MLAKTKNVSRFYDNEDDDVHDFETDQPEYAYNHRCYKQKSTKTQHNYNDDSDDD